MLLSIPWLILPVVSYFGIIWIGTSFYDAGVQETMDYALIDNIKLLSDGIWKLTVSEVLLIFTLVVLFVEIIKATRVSSMSLVDHSLSTLLFVICLILFITITPAASSTFFLITVMTLIDVVAGFSITLRSARRDVGFGGHMPH